MPKQPLFRTIVVLLCALLAFAGPARAQGGPVIAVASNMQGAIGEIAQRYRQDGGAPVRPAFGSSGSFVRQIEQGSPFQLFISADEESVLRLADAGRLEDRGVLYASGRLVLFAPLGSALVPDAEMRGLGEALAAGRIQRFAIANPEHAPYGRAAEQALRALGLWEALRTRLVLGENVSQAAQFAVSGAAQGGIFAHSVALSPAFQGRGSYALLPERLHRPLRQRMALVKSAGPEARAFFAYLQQPAAGAVLKRHGFTLPGE